MRNSRSSHLSLILATALSLNGCGTRDYAPAPLDSRVRAEEKRTTAPSSPVNPRPLVTGAASPGYLWGGLKWIGLPDDMLANLKCRLEDGPSVNEFKVFGTTVIGGAILGMVIRGSGSWFLGKPTEPAPGHWFWNRLDETIKVVGQGSFRGALLAGGCETLLAGGNFSPLAGILGQAFAALSGAITLGGLTSLAAAPFITKLMSETGPNAPVEAQDRAGIGAAGDGNGISWRDRFSQFKEWTTTSDLSRGVRYRVAPGLMIVGLGTGVGYLIYNQFDVDNPNPKCAQEKPAAP